MNIPYQNFPKYVLRSHQMAISSFKELTGRRYINHESLKNLFNDPAIQESIFLASPGFYDEIKKWISGDITEKEKINKIRNSFLKYIARMSSRCTPFGLFAGCSLGKFSENTSLVLNDTKYHKRHTGLDMNFLVAFAQELVKKDIVRSQIKFYPNTSIYHIDAKLRYIEYTYTQGNRKHHIMEVDNNQYLYKILDFAKEGALLSSLSASLVDKDITREQSSEFINELIDSQLLISELEPSLCGPEFLDQILNVLTSMQGVEDIIQTARNIKTRLSEIDQTTGNTPEVYISLYDELKKLNTNFDPKFLFQTDLVLSTAENTIDQSIINDINKGFVLLNRLTQPRPENSTLSRFKQAFRERYETREVELSKVLDLEMGIGYNQNQDAGDSSPLIDNFFLPRNEEEMQDQEILWSPRDKILHKKLLAAYENGDYTVHLNNKEFESFELSWHDLPDTLSFMVQLLKIDGTDKIKFDGGGGSSAANLIGRFCFSDKEINVHAQTICSLEEQLQEGKILAEIIHLPESRVGNILMRPSFRNYEIPYLSMSSLAPDNQIPISDLMLSIKNDGRFFLRSKKHNKEVIPRLTNAHNFAQNALPIYQFLSELQTQNVRSGVGFSFGPFSKDISFLPRVEFENLILKEATWHLKKREIQPLINALDDDDLLAHLNTFRQKWKLPQFVTLVDGDNKLLINLENIDMIRVFLSTVKKRERFTLNEFLFTEDGVLTNDNHYYANQIVVSFFNHQKLKNVSKNTKS